jgi:nitrate/nitrite-specific signal transduction histidine kinase
MWPKRGPRSSAPPAGGPSRRPTPRAQVTRDLHDGAQQRFVTAVLNLQLADGAAGSDPDEAARLREAAAEEARAGLAELRELAAGMHPGILTDRGLGAAVESLASKLPVDVSVAQTLERRLPAPPPGAMARVHPFCSGGRGNLRRRSQWLSSSRR